VHTHLRPALPLLAALVACHGPGASDRPAPPASTGPTLTLTDTMITATFDAAGTAEPAERATLATKLLGSVTQVLVREGDRVSQDQILARVDARDVEAKRAQVDANITAAQAVYQDAETQAGRFRALYADSAATKYQLDQAETGLARAEAGLNAARAARAELDAVGSYAVIRAPFPGVVTRRYVDPGAFVAPGAPMLDLQDPSRLRVSVTVPPPVAASLKRGQSLELTIEDRSARGVLEGAVPAETGAVYTVNAIVDNAGRQYLAGSAAVIRIPAGRRPALLVPATAVVHEGDLTGVRVRTGQAVELRWVKVGATVDGRVELLAGVHAGDVIFLGGD